MAEHEIDVLKLGIDIGKLNASDINNIRSLTNNLKDLDNILTNSFMKKLEVLSNIKINVDTSSLKKANTQISKTTSDIRGMLQTEEVSIGGGSGKSRDELINNYRKIINDTKKSLNSVEADLASAKGSPLEPILKERVEEHKKLIQQYHDQINEMKKKPAVQKTLAGDGLGEAGIDFSKVTDKASLLNAKLKLIDNELKDETISEKKHLSLLNQKITAQTQLNKLVNEENKVVDKTGKISEKQGKKGGIFGKLGKSIARIAIYRAIRAGLKTITQSIKEGIAALAEFNPEFNKTMTAITSATKNLKMSYTLAFAPLIEAVAPAFISFANSLTNINNRISETIAYLKGVGEYTRVNTEYQEEYNKAVNLLPFDKFNVLNNASAYGGLEKVAVDTEKMAKNAGKIEKLREIIKTFKETFNSVREAIKPVWELIKGIANEYGDEILSFMKSNMEFSGELWKTLGLIANLLKDLFSSDFTKSMLYISISSFSGAMQTIMNIVKTINELLDALFNRNWEGLGSRLGGIWKSGWDTTVDTGKTGWGKVSEWFKGVFGKQRFSIGGFANGGLPTRGSLFLAGERGAELVTNMNNSQSAVMNMQQLQEAVYYGMLAAMSSSRQTNNTTSNKIEIKIGEETLFEVVRKTANSKGFDFANV